MSRAFLRHKEKRRARAAGEPGWQAAKCMRQLVTERTFLVPALSLTAVLALIIPNVFSTYQTNIMITALMYVMLGLSLNIVVFFPA